MKRRIFGFQRRVWWPKWTPASSSSRRSTWVSVAIEAPWVRACAVVPVRRRRGPGVLVPGRTRWALRSGSGVQERVSVEAMELHPLAAQFADVAENYELGRPEYPQGVVELLGLSPGARVLDLAAGTGKLTRVLRAGGLDVVPVEPLPRLRARIPGAVDGRAEAIPLDDASVDAVTIGDAWHWFDRE